MTKHEQTIESHVDSNVAVAIDQADEYGGLEGAFHSFSQNTMDSVLEDGYSGEEALDATMWFARKFNEKTGLSL
jgi:hypothetical protein